MYASGTLIHPKYLITAAHTFDAYLKKLKDYQKKYKKDVDSIRTEMAVKQGLKIKKFTVVDWWISKQYKPQGSDQEEGNFSEVYADDFAIMKLEPAI